MAQLAAVAALLWGAAAAAAPAPGNVSLVPYPNCTKSIGARFCYEGLEVDVPAPPAGLEWLQPLPPRRTCLVGCRSACSLTLLDLSTP